MGTSVTFVLQAVDLRDHPHAYGDKYVIIVCFNPRIGSSPRVWGQDTINLHVWKKTGIIPTRMGTSAIVSRAIFRIWDHPHAYGDKIFYTSFPVTLPGSSPRVWGQVIKLISPAIKAGIIPTRMGTRYWWWHYTTTIKDHPHAYGDKYNFQHP